MDYLNTRQLGLPQAVNMNISTEVFWLIYFLVFIVAILVSGFLVWHWKKYSINQRVSNISQAVYIVGVLIILILLAISIATL